MLIRWVGDRTGSIRKLHPRHLEGIALIDVPGLDAGPEPVDPVFGGTVGERIGNDKAPGPLLQAGVPDGAGRARAWRPPSISARTERRFPSAWLTRARSFWTFSEIPSRFCTW